MITNNQQNPTENFLSLTNMEVTEVSPNWQTPPIQPTPYHYLALLPALLTAATPLILGLVQSDFLRRLNSKGATKQDRQQTTEDDE